MGRIFLTEAAIQRKMDAAMEGLANKMHREGFSDEAIHSWLDKVSEHHKSSPDQNLDEKIWAYSHGFMPEYVKRFGITEKNQQAFLSEAEYDSLYPINGDMEKTLRNQVSLRGLVPDYQENFPKIYGEIKWKNEKQVFVNDKSEGDLREFLKVLDDKKHVVIRSVFYTQKEFRRELASSSGSYLVNEQVKSPEELLQMIQEREKGLVVMEACSWHHSLLRYTGSRSKIQLLVHKKTAVHAHVDKADLRVNPTKILPIALETGYCVYNPLEKIEFEIPYWKELLARVEKICSALPGAARLMRVSLVVTEQSFQITSIEGNLEFSQNELLPPEVVGMLNEQLVLHRAAEKYPDEKFRNVNQVHYFERNQTDRKARQKYVEEYFSRNLGYVPNLEEPKTFNEKICWYKLFYENPLVTTCCDKYAVKQYVADTIGPEYAIPVLGVWNNPEEVDYDSLPQQFVLKVNWASGFNIIVSDKSIFQKEEAQKKLERWMRPYNNSYYHSYNWGYKDMKPVIYAEEYIEQEEGQVYDYKLYCCNGKVSFLFVVTDRYGEERLTYNYFSPEFEPYPFCWGGCGKTERPLERPKQYDLMVELAEKLAQPFPFVRVDFYEAGNRIYIGEMTFYSGGGRNRMEPQEWDSILGEKVPIPEPILMN